MTSVNQCWCGNIRTGCESCYTMRMNFQDTIKETSEQIKIHLKDKQIKAISSLLTDIIGASFAASGIQQLVSYAVSGDGSEVNSYWSCTRPFFPTQYTKKSGLAMRD